MFEFDLILDLGILGERLCQIECDEVGEVQSLYIYDLEGFLYGKEARVVTDKIKDVIENHEEWKRNKRENKLVEVFGE